MRIKNLFREYKVKIVVFFIALLLWFHVVTEQYYEYDYWIPIEPANIRSGKVIENKIPKRALVKFRGKGKALIALSNANVKIILDLNEVERYAKIELRKEDVNIMPRRLNVEALAVIKPDSVEIILGRAKTKLVPITPNISVEPEAGYTVVGGVRVEPDSVMVKGPEKLLGEIKRVLTERKIYKSAKKDVFGKVKLIPPSDERLSIEMEEVHFFADVQKLAEKTITNVPIKVINIPKKLKVTVVPSTLSLKLEGGVDLLLTLTREDIMAYIDYRRYRKSKEGKVPAIIKTPQGTRFAEVFPKSFSLIIER